MTINAKTLVQDRFWIIQENGEKIGTLQKQDNNDWIFLSKKDQRETFNNEKALIHRFGTGLFENTDARQDIVDTNETQEHDVHGYPVNQRAYNPMFDVQKQLPIYTKTPKSKSLFCAGYYIICFEKGWRKAYCPKVITLQRYPFKGPFKTNQEYKQAGVNADIYLMPVGATVEGQAKTSRQVAEICLKYGYRYSGRLHVDLFGNKWGT